MKNKYKSIPVYWNGKPLKRIYPYATQFQVFKYKVRMFLRKLFISVVIAGALAGGLFILRAYYPNVIYQVVEKEVIIDNLQAKINQLKGEIMSDLKHGESSGLPESAGLIVFDTNKLPSIGSYQFQIKTVQHYVKKFEGRDITRKEAILIALDDNKAGKLAYEIMFKEKDGWVNWYNTSKKYNIEKRLEVIKKLES